jgi:hypothetical protein
MALSTSATAPWNFILERRHAERTLPAIGFWDVREKVRDFEAEQSKLAGELLDRRAKALQKAEAIDYKTAFSMAAKRHPDLARAYGIPDPDRPAQVPWYCQPAPKWRRSV